jgi:hypothetical protein
MWSEFVSDPFLRPENAGEILRHIGFVLIPLAIVAYRIAEPLALGALIVIATGSLMGKRPTMGEAIRRSMRRMWPLLVMWFVRWVCIKIGALACSVPGLVLAGLFSVSAPAVLLERKGAFAALGRSIELNKERLFPASLLIFLLGLIEWLISQLPQLLPTPLLQAIGMAACYTCTLVLYSCAVTVFYFSGRCKMENYDLQLLAEQVASAPDEEATDEKGTLFSSESGSG